MVSFSFFCEIEAYLERYENQRRCALRMAGLSESEAADDFVFLTLIDQCDAGALRQLMDYFDPAAPIQELLRSRLRFLDAHREAVPAKAPERRRDGSFFLYLLDWITRKGYATEADFYNYAGISRQRFSKLRRDDGAVSRELALHLAVGLELNYEESAAFLQRAGYSLKPANRREAIISYVMRNQKYTFAQMEEILYLLQERTFLEA